MSADRPIFHSEADFQHSLADVVRRLAPTVRVELESRPVADRRWRIDLSLIDETSRERVLVELKYATRKLTADVGGKRYSVKDHAAQDITRHDFIKDVLRLETAQRLSCEPKNNANPRYLWYSNAVSALNWIIQDLQQEATD